MGLLLVLLFMNVIQVSCRRIRNGSLFTPFSPICVPESIVPCEVQTIRCGSKTCTPLGTIVKLCCCLSFSSPLLHCRHTLFATRGAFDRACAHNAICAGCLDLLLQVCLISHRIMQTPTSAQGFVDRWRGANVDDLQLPAAFALPGTE